MLLCDVVHRAAQARPHSAVSSRSRRGSELAGRRLSVPAPYHLSTRPHSVLACPTPDPPRLALSREQIDRDVLTILRNLDIQK